MDKKASNQMFPFSFIKQTTIYIYAKLAKNSKSRTDLYVNVNNLIGLIEKENAKKDDVFAKKLVRLYTKELLALLSR